MHVLNDILMSLDQQKSVLLVLLHLSTTFDTTDPELLPNCLSDQLGIGGIVLDWVYSYLLERTPSVSIGESKLTTQWIMSGVPQVSVLRPIFFIIYTHPLGNIIKKHDMTSHHYADATQLYLTLDGFNNIERNSGAVHLRH